MKKILKHISSIVIVLAMTIMLLPLSSIVVHADVGPDELYVYGYDISMRAFMPEIAGATNYKLYISTSEDADLEALTADTNKRCVMDSDTFEPFVYIVNDDKDVLDEDNILKVSITPSTQYYFYYVTNDGTSDTLSKTYNATTQASVDYWTDAGHYDTSWYGDGSADIFTISSGEDLAGLAVLVNNLDDTDSFDAIDFAGKTINLTNDLYMSDYLWTAIGTDSYHFAGTFNGENNTVYYLHTNDKDKDNQGLFGYSTGTIKNVGIADGQITGRYQVAGILGYCEGGTVNNCYNTGDVYGVSSNPGGVVGQAKNALISNCYNKGTVYSWVNIGGVVGNAQDTTIENCYNAGLLKDGVYIGGVVNSASGVCEITNCYNTGTISDSNYAAGIVYNTEDTCTITNCYNTGAMINNVYAGGIVSNIQDGDCNITNCYNVGTFKECMESSGIAYFSYGNCVVTNCYSASSYRNFGIANDEMGVNPVTATNSYCTNSNTGVSTGAITFLKLDKTFMTKGETATITKQSIETVNTALKPYFGEDFAIAYVDFAFDKGAILDDTITATSYGDAHFTYNLTITQNELTSSGFTGVAKEIVVPISMDIYVEKPCPDMDITVSSETVKLGETITITATLSGGENPTGNVEFTSFPFDIGDVVEIGSSIVSAEYVATIEYTPTQLGEFDINADYIGDENNNGNGNSKTITVITADSDTPPSDDGDTSGDSDTTQSETTPTPTPSEPVITPAQELTITILPTEVTDETPATTLQGAKEEIKDAVLTEEDKAKLESGSNISIKLTVEKIDVPKADEDAIKLIVNDGSNKKLAQYLDLSLIKIIDGTEEKVTQTNSPIQITIDIPQNLRSAGRTFSIVRLHDGVVTTLNDLDDNPDTITFGTDQFSTYAIAYEDTVVEKNPKTGDNSLLPISLIAILSVSTFIISRKKIKA